MIWKARSRGRRLGIVALAAVVTDPGPIDDSAELAELETSATGLEERLEWTLMGQGGPPAASGGEPDMGVRAPIARARRLGGAM